MNSRAYNSRIKQTVRALKDAGAKRVEVEIAPDGSVRVFEPVDTPRKGDASSILERRMGGVRGG